MAKRKKTSVEEPLAAAAPEGYTVLARRYRPQQFNAVVGQEPVARALVNALESNRVAHAYLFTGARGVGKTSMARILAKALNCEQGPTPTPCDRCEICQSIAAGEDIDVLEIDGASNRGIDEIRELRRNANLRPSRARCKIYIIDEVHMLTKDAFNALLKTLEEPPGHVKFIFATTEVQKIPVTVLSRCQRFDFAGISAARIVEQLKQVVAGEKMEADDDALEWIARRAAGSMRDSQSLLDQLLAFNEENQRLTLEHIHRLLGTANDDRVVALADAVLERDAKRALELLDQAADAGTQLGELLDQLIAYWRDLMVVNCAGAQGKDLSVTSKHRATLAKQAQAVPMDMILAGLDILAATKARLRTSQYARVLLEMALVRLARLEDLVALSDLAQRLAQGTPSAQGFKAQQPRSERPAAGQRGEAQLVAPSAIDGLSARGGLNTGAQTASGTQTTEAELDLTEQTLPQIWPRVVGQLGGIHAGHLEKATQRTVVPPRTLVLRFPASYNADQAFCADARRVNLVEEALKKVTSQAWSLRFESVPSGAAAEAAAAGDAAKPAARNRQKRTEALQEPLVKRALEQLEAQIVNVDDGFGAAPPDASLPEADNEENP